MLIERGRGTSSSYRVRLRACDRQRQSALHDRSTKSATAPSDRGLSKFEGARSSRAFRSESGTLPYGCASNDSGRGQLCRGRYSRQESRSPRGNALHGLSVDVVDLVASALDRHELVSLLDLRSARDIGYASSYGRSAAVLHRDRCRVRSLRRRGRIARLRVVRRTERSRSGVSRRVRRRLRTGGGIESETTWGRTRSVLDQIEDDEGGKTDYSWRSRCQMG